MAKLNDARERLRAAARRREANRLSALDSMRDKAEEDPTYSVPAALNYRRDMPTESLVRLGCAVIAVASCFVAGITAFAIAFGLELARSLGIGG